MKRMIIATTALLAAPLLAVADPVVNNLLSNGSFDNTVVANSSWNVSTTPNGWITGGAGLELRNNVAGKAFDGSNFAELDSNSNSSISQVVSTVVGQWYLLSFEYSNRTGVEAASNGLSWSFGNASGDAPTLAKNISGDNDWQLFSTQIQATSTQTTLKLWATGTSDGLGTSLDAVSLSTVSSVPEPQTYALLGAGFLAMGFVMRRRRQAD